MRVGLWSAGVSSNAYFRGKKKSGKERELGEGEGECAESKNNERASVCAFVCVCVCACVRQGERTVRDGSLCNRVCVVPWGFRGNQGEKRVYVSWSMTESKGDRGVGRVEKRERERVKERESETESVCERVRASESV